MALFYQATKVYYSRKFYMHVTQVLVHAQILALVDDSAFNSCCFYTTLSFTIF